MVPLFYIPEPRTFLLFKRAVVGERAVGALAVTRLFDEIPHQKKSGGENRYYRDNPLHQKTESVIPAVAHTVVSSPAIDRPGAISSVRTGEGL